MKNLKRALSLVLSAAMMVGMMVMGTGAAELKDIKGHDNQQAAELMAMIGVMEGDGTNFNPDKVVTRNEMAVVMCNLLGLKLNGAHPFTDVASWADKYVAAIYTNGYTAGKTATTFGGSDEITTAEAALMIMKTLGYFEFQGEFGSDWKLATVKQATKLELLKNVEAGINDKLTRGEVAEMVMNALEKYVVITTEKGGMSVEGNGISVTQKAEYDYDDTELLMDKLFDGDLDHYTFADNGTTDDFGRPAVKWTFVKNNKTESVLIANKPAFVYTENHADNDKITKALKDYTFADGTAVFTDGSNNETAIDMDDVYTLTGNGKTVEIFANKMNVQRVVVINEELAKVTGITAANETTGAKRYVTIAGGETFETENFARKDMVLYTMANGAIKSMKLASTVEGKITATASSYIKIDGVTYKTSDGYHFTNQFALGNTVKAYVDSCGFVIGLEEVVKTAAVLADYVVITQLSTADSFGKYQAKVLYADGTKATVTIDATGTDVLAVRDLREGILYTTKKTDDGVEFYAAPNAEDAGFDATLAASEVNDKDTATLGGYKIADDAVFFVNYNDNGAKYKIMNGAEIKKLADGTVTSIIAYANKATTGYNTIELAHVSASTVTAIEDIAYGYVVADVEVVKNADDKNVKSVTFWNGKETVTVLATESYSANLIKGDFFTYNLNNKGELTNVVEIVNGANDYAVAAVTAFDGKYINAGATYEFDKDTIVIYVDTKNDKGVTEGEIELADETFDNNGDVDGYVNNVIVKADGNGKVDILFVDINNKMLINAQ